MSNLIPFTQRLIDELSNIERSMMDFLDISTIEKTTNDPYSNVVVFVPDYYWGSTDDRQKVAQIELLKNYNSWFEQFRLLFRNVSEEIEQKIKEVNGFILSWIEKKSWDWNIPSSIEQAKEKFSSEIKVLYELIKMFQKSEQINLIVVPDTNALIKAPDITQYSTILSRNDYTVVIVPTVLEELDKLKIVHRERDFRDKVESVIKRIKGFRTQGSLLKGVTVNKTVTVKMVAQEPKFEDSLKWLDPQNFDDRIIASVLEIQIENPTTVVALVTSDINLQNKAEMANLPFVEPPDQ